MADGTWTKSQSAQQILQDVMKIETVLSLCESMDLIEIAAFNRIQRSAEPVGVMIEPVARIRCANDVRQDESRPTEVPGERLLIGRCE